MIKPVTIESLNLRHRKYFNLFNLLQDYMLFEIIKIPTIPLISYAMSLIIQHRNSHLKKATPFNSSISKLRAVAGFMFRKI